MSSNQAEVATIGLQRRDPAYQSRKGAVVHQQDMQGTLPWCLQLLKLSVFDDHKIRALSPSGTGPAGTAVLSPHTSGALGLYFGFYSLSLEE